MPTTRQWEIQNSMFRTLVDCFFSRDFLRAQNMGNENYFDLAGGSSYRGFELPRVKLQKMYEGNPGEIYFGSS